MHNLIYFPSFGSRASNYGLVRFDDTGRVLQFFEKPRRDDIESMVSIALSTHSFFLLHSLVEHIILLFRFLVHLFLVYL
jgi:ADP-glucose pyrophosphorylase